MTYPQAIVIAAAILGGAVIATQQGRADLTGRCVAVTVENNAAASFAWVAREDGQVRACWHHPNPTTNTADASCTDWK